MRGVPHSWSMKQRKRKSLAIFAGRRISNLPASWCRWSRPVPILYSPRGTPARILSQDCHQCIKQSGVRTVSWTKEPLRLARESTDSCKPSVRIASEVSKQEQHGAGGRGASRSAQWPLSLKHVVAAERAVLLRPSHFVIDNPRCMILMHVPQL